jgi:hypothetical protein
MLIIKPQLPIKGHFASVAHIPRIGNREQPNIWKSRQTVCGLVFGSDLVENNGKDEICVRCQEGYK